VLLSLLLLHLVLLLKIVVIHHLVLFLHIIVEQQIECQLFRFVSALERHSNHLFSSLVASSWFLLQEIHPPYVPHHEGLHSREAVGFDIFSEPDKFEWCGRDIQISRISLYSGLFRLLVPEVRGPAAN
jgi:hypothetical protein